jgi:hypothetical protein
MEAGERVQRRAEQSSVKALHYESGLGKPETQETTAKNLSQAVDDLLASNEAFLRA